MQTKYIEVRNLNLRIDKNELVNFEIELKNLLEQYAIGEGYNYEIKVLESK